MRQARRIIFICLVGSFLAAFAGLALKQHELSYHGKALNEWLEEVSSSDVHEYTDANPEAIRAIRQIGTKGVPTLLRLAAAKDTKLKEFLLDNENQPWMIKLHLHSANESHHLAIAGFAVLGSDAQPAVPELIALLESDDLDVRICAAFCLGFIGRSAQAAVPDLIKELEREEKDGGGAPAAYVLRDIGPPTDRECLPALALALTNALTNMDFGVRAAAQAELINLNVASLSPFIEQLKDFSSERKWRYAATVVAGCGTNATRAIPALLAALSQTNYEIQSYAMSVLSEIHQQPDACVPALMRFLDTSNSNVRAKAAYDIGKFGKSAQPAVPALTHSLSDRKPRVRKFAGIALREIDPEAAAKLEIK